MSQAIYSNAAPKPIGPYSQAIRCGDFLFISGQLAIDPKTGVYTPTLSADEETKIVLQHIGVILKAAQLTYQDIVKTSIFLTKMKDFPLINAVYEKFFSCTDKQFAPPARETIEVAGLPLGAKVEISCIASCKT